MPFGLKNAAQSFQRFLDQVLQGLDFCFAYIDDLLIASTDLDTHLHHVKQVLERLQQHGLSIHPNKCEFGQSSLSFLGHLVSADGIAVLPGKVDAIREFPLPTTRRQIREFVGLVNFYRRFLPNCSSLLHPLTDLLAGAKVPKNRPLVLPDCAVLSFHAAKDALAKATLLSHPVPGATLQLMVDASDVGVGGVLQQFIDSTWQPLAFFSKRLQPAEVKYSTFGRELLATYLSVKHFRHFLEGRSFAILTDHRALVSAVGSQSNNYSPREIRHLTFITEFTTDVQHVAGTANVVADALSRGSIDSVAPPPVVDFTALAQAQQVDPELESLLSKDRSTSLMLELVPWTGTEIQLYCDMSSGKARPFVPTSFRQEVFQSIHNLAHTGVRATRKLLTDRFVWPGIRTDVATWVRQCVPCQRSKVQRHTKSPIGTFRSPSVRFANIHLDLVGPLPPSSGMTYLLTIVDRYTRWPEAIPLPNMQAATVASVFVSHWVARFGVPESVTTDRGGQFEAALFASLTNLLGCRHLRTTAYHPQANGMVERFHRQLKASLRTTSAVSHWVEQLPLILLGFRTAIKTDSGVSSAEMLYGSNLRLPGEFFTSTSQVPPDPSSFVGRLQYDLQQLRPIPVRAPLPTRPVYLPSDLQTADKVFLRRDAVRRPLQPPYDGPYKVLKRSSKYFEIDVNGRVTLVSVDRLKPAHLSE